MKYETDELPRGLTQISIRQRKNYFFPKVVARWCNGLHTCVVGKHKWLRILHVAFSIICIFFYSFSAIHIQIHYHDHYFPLLPAICLSNHSFICFIIRIIQKLFIHSSASMSFLLLCPSTIRAKLEFSNNEIDLSIK